MLSNSSNNRLAEVYFFCKDGRILPALGQQTFAMIEIEHPNVIRLHNASKEVSSSVGDILKQTGWLRNSDGQEPDNIDKFAKTLKYHVLQYSCGGNIKENPPTDTPNNPRRINLHSLLNHERSSKEMKEEKELDAASTQILIGKLLLAMNKQGLNLYATTQLSCSTKYGASRSQLIFRQSNVGYSQSLCLNLLGSIAII